MDAPNTTPALTTAPAPAATPPAPSTPSDAAANGMRALLRAMVQMKASDLHVSAATTPTVRHDGEIVPLPGCRALSSQETEQLLLSIAPPRAREQFLRRHDADFAYEIEGLSRFRCNLFVDRKGAGGVIRVVNR